MKPLSKSVLLLALLSFVAQSCFKKPEAAFSYEPTDKPESGETVEFTNESLDAKDLFWDFGNDQHSEEEMPSTVFQLPGTYTVTLVAENLFHSDSISENILIYPPTILEFYFYDYDGNPLTLGRAELYLSYNDAMTSNNQIKSGSTNTFGMVRFSNLDAIQYYLWFEKESGAGAYLSGGYVGPLNQNEVNSYYAFVDYYTSGEKKIAATKGIQLIEPKTTK